jgi:HEAT repeat protein
MAEGPTTHDSDVVRHLQSALRDASPEALSTWADTGMAGLLALRDYLTDADGSRSWAPDVHPKVAIDNTVEAVVAIAAAHPNAFLEVFSDDRLDVNTFVLNGLGQIDDPRATRRLINATRSRERWARMCAAIGLSRRASPAASVALADLIDDPEYLVRYHAMRSLASVGDLDALPSLRRIDPSVRVEGELAAEAIASILARASGATPSR